MAPQIWREPPGFELCDKNRKALSHQFELQANIDDLVHSVQHGLCDPDKILSKLLIAQKDIRGIESHFKRTIKPIYFHERRTSDSTIATRVLGIPELLELILEHIRFVDLLNMTQVSRTIRANMDGSPRLQKMLCLQAAEPSDGILLCPFASCVKGNGGFRFKVNKKESIFTARFLSRPGKEPPTIGPLWKKRFICQPPVTRAEAHVDCCPAAEAASDGFDSTRMRTIDSESGITIGHLYDVMKELIVQHKDCDDCRIIFKGCIEISAA